MATAAIKPMTVMETSRIKTRAVKIRGTQRATVSTRYVWCPKPLDAGADRGETEKRLFALPGIGAWTAA